MTRASRGGRLLSPPIAFALAAPSLITLLLAAGPSAAADPPWHINTPQVIADEERTVNGSIIVEQGGTLTLRNASLLFNLATEGGLNLTVQAGGSLVVENGTLRASDAARLQGRHWNFLVSGHLEMRRADVSDMRGDVGLGGLEISGSDALIEDSVVHHNRYYGVYLRSGAPVVRRTTFESNVVGVFVLPGASPILEDLVVRNSTSFGLKINDASPVVRNLTVTGSSNFAVGAVGSILDIRGCRLSGGQVGIDAALGTTGVVDGCEFLSLGTGLRAQDSPVNVGNSTFFNTGLGVNATRSAVQVAGSSFLNVDTGVRVQDAVSGVYGGEATGNNFSAVGVGVELHVSNFFLADNSYGAGVTATRVYHEVTLVIVDRAGSPVLRARVNITAADGVRVFSGLTNDTGAVTATLEEFRELGNGTRLNLTPHAVHIERGGFVTETTVNATSDHAERISLVDPPAAGVLGITREALLLVGAVIGIAAALGALGMRARRRDKAKADGSRPAARRRGPRSGR